MTAGLQPFMMLDFFTFHISQVYILGIAKSKLIQTSSIQSVLNNHHSKYDFPTPEFDTPRSSLSHKLHHSSSFNLATATHHRRSSLLCIQPSTLPTKDISSSSFISHEIQVQFRERWRHRVRAQELEDHRVHNGAARQVVA